MQRGAAGIGDLDPASGLQGGAPRGMIGDSRDAGRLEEGENIVRSAPRSDQVPLRQPGGAAGAGIEAVGEFIEVQDAVLVVVIGIGSVAAVGFAASAPFTTEPSLL